MSDAIVGGRVERNMAGVLKMGLLSFFPASPKRLTQFGAP